MQSTSEVVCAFLSYFFTIVCFMIIYILTEKYDIPIDFRMFVNATGNHTHMNFKRA